MALAYAVVSACASVQPFGIAPKEPYAPAAELTSVPFFPQQIHECGPAALATVLGASGIDVAPAILAPKVYIPGRRGSLQTELIAAARQYERLPYVLDQSLEAISREVRAGRPVLVLQNFGVRSIPRWHYAVVVGVTKDHVILRSGRQAHVLTRVPIFLRTWSYADEWAVVLLKPGEMPIAPAVDRWISANAGFEATGHFAAARLNYQAAAGVWPDHSLIWLGLGNTEYRAGHREAAEVAFTRAVQVDDHNAAALNNLAQTLAERGCRDRARTYLKQAREVAAPGLRTAIETTEKELRMSLNPETSDPVECAQAR